MIISLTNVPSVSLGCQLKLHDRYRFIVNTWKTGQPRRLQKPRGTRPFVRCATYWNPDQKPVVRTEAIGNHQLKTSCGNRNNWNHRPKTSYGNRNNWNHRPKTSHGNRNNGVTDQKPIV